MNHTHTDGAWKVQISGTRDDGRRGLPTKVVLRVARAFPVRPVSTFWTVGKVIVLVSDVLKEVNLFFSLKETSGNSMHHGVSPALNKLISAKSGSR